ncbi:MAG TPA: hypothetical protein VK530_03050 [Candidatus Acidoferrum sp.]|nr:hypothetical protein [Candidatus Acidoferrum sp.]
MSDAPVTRDEFNALLARVMRLEKMLRAADVTTFGRARLHFIQARIAEFFKVEPTIVVSLSKAHEISHIRHAFWMMADEFGGLSHHKIAAFNGVSQANVSGAIRNLRSAERHVVASRKQRSLRYTSPAFAEQMMQLRELVRDGVAQLNDGAIAGVDEERWREWRERMDTKEEAA